MEEKKTKIVKLVTVWIAEDKLYEDRFNVLIFRFGRSTIMFPKKELRDFEKVETWFPTWKGRIIKKAFKFKIPLWLYNDRKAKLDPTTNINLKIENTHQ